MTTRNTAALSLALVLALAGASTVNAQSAASTTKGNSTSSAATTVKGNATSSATSTKIKTDNATSTAAKAKTNSTSTKAQNATSTAVKGGTNGADHRSAVATFVKTLLDSADRLGGIGQEVRVIANEQASSSEKVSAAIDDVSKRNGFLTFLVGSDYKTLGDIKSEIGKTEVRIAKLQSELEKIEGISDETLIETEITALEAELAKVKAFVDENESKFSLFGWMRN